MPKAKKQNRSDQETIEQTLTHLDLVFDQYGADRGDNQEASARYYSSVRAGMAPNSGDEG